MCSLLDLAAFFARYFHGCEATFQHTQHVLQFGKLAGELGLYCRSGDFDKAYELLPRIERGLAQHAGSMGPVRLAGDRKRHV